MPPMHVLVVTCAHRGDDARIVHRQARALLERGHAVTLVAPLPDSTAADPDGLTRVGIRRAVGRRRLGAWRDVRREVGARVGAADLVLLHDPELVLVASRRWMRRPVVWDVHEDFVASVGDRAWIPRPLRRSVVGVVRALQRRASRRMHLLVAEHSYLADLPDAVMVPNSTWVPSTRSTEAVHRPPEVVYVGRISHGRGLAEMVEVGRRLAGDGRVVIVGAADGSVRDELERAAADGAVDWRGPLPNPEALGVARGAVAGLALLHDEPNYRHSMPTKLIEYMAQGVPVITTPLPLAEELVTASGGGVVVPFGPSDRTADAVVEAVRQLAEDPARREAMAAAGHAYVAEHHSWSVDGARFVDTLERWAAHDPDDGDAQ